MTGAPSVHGQGLSESRLAAVHGPGGAVAAGAASGFMNVTAGVGGPAMVLYATVLLVAVAALVEGLVGGDLLSRRISRERASRAVMGLAVAGAISTVAKGLLSL